MELFTMSNVFCLDALRSLALLVLVIHVCTEQGQHLSGWLELVAADSMPLHEGPNAKDVLQKAVFHSIAQFGLDQIHLRECAFHSCVAEWQCQK